MAHALTRCNICALLFLSLFSLVSAGQELRCTVQINYDKAPGANSTFETLKQSIEEYLNNTAFTECQLSPSERIECQLMLLVDSYDNNVVSGELQVQSLRPVYDSAYTSTLLNHRDSKIDFEYQEGDPLVFSSLQPDRQLTALLDYYAYLILALDFDTFSLHGGQPYWDSLNRIVMQYQNSGYTGWSAYDDNRNRGAIADSFTQSPTRGIRDVLYQYHRHGLDMMLLAPDKGRQAIVASIGDLHRIHQLSPMSVCLAMFKDAKLSELVNILSKAPDSQRQNAYHVLSDVYPSEHDVLEKIHLGEKYN